MYKDNFLISASIFEESNSGWVWLSPNSELVSRDHIELMIPSNGKSCVCWCRIIDDNFITIYNGKNTKNINIGTKNLIINDHYRNILSLEKNKYTEVQISKINKWQYIKKIKALLHHPDNAIKLATYLAIWSIALGLLGIVFGVISLFQNKCPI